MMDRSAAASSFDLSGKTVLVTGASSGLGAHFASVLGAHGAVVVLAARRVDRLRDMEAALHGRGVGARVVGMDVTDAGSIEAALAEAGAVDVVVNNAGITLARPLLEQSEADWDQVMETNLKGAFLVLRGAARAMRERGRGGSIINIASILGLRQAGQVAGYAASKAGLIQLTKVAAAELARFGVRVNAIAPGYFATDLNTDFRDSPAGAALIKRIPQRRLGEPHELDGPLLLLASDLSSYMTGCVIPVDGGHLCSTL
jgi:NAD(P)-dependent dehydrogenase (short-subunit alcohol dehydrogenase family)